MSITHRFKFKSDKTEEEILQIILSSNVGLLPATYDEMKGDGLFGRVATISNISQQGFQEEYNFPANIAVSFDEDSDGNIEEGEKIMGRAVALILRQEEGDAIFFYVIDTPILKRINGKIQVAQEKWFYWLRNALDEANLQYELKPKEELQ